MYSFVGYVRGAGEASHVGCKLVLNTSAIWCYSKKTWNIWHNLELCS